MSTTTSKPSAPGAKPPRDEITHAKLMLLHVDDSAPSLGDSISGMVRRYPYAAAALAAAAGLLLGKGALGKKLATLAGAWAVKQFLSGAGRS